MPPLPKPAGNSGIAKRVVVSLLVGTVLFTVGALIYTSVHYASAMPQYPRPETGNVYRVTAANGTTVYVNKREFDWNNFICYDLMGLSGIFMLVLYYLKVTLKWF
jgi:hypothetical protein